MLTDQNIDRLQSIDAMLTDIRTKVLNIALTQRVSDTRKDDILRKLGSLAGLVAGLEVSK